MTLRQRYITLILALICATVSHALHAEATPSVPDSIEALAAEKPRKLNLMQRVIKYFDESNKTKPGKRFDFTFVGGPNYDQATSLQLAVMGSGLYYSRMDSLTPVSNVTLFVQGSLSGFYRVGISGEHYGPSDKYRILYCGDFAHFPLKFWGLGYTNASHDNNESKYTELRTALWADMQWRIGKALFVGPSVNFDFTKATKVERPELWQGQDLSVFDYGIGLGFSLSLDTRDYSTNASKGENLKLKQFFYPKFIKNRYSFSSTELTFGIYRRIWSSAVIAAQVHAMATYGNTPWSMLPTVDATNAVRGYFEGRYRDKNEADLVVELRQHVWQRIGVVVWGGAATVFRHFSDVRLNSLLPTYGIGGRFEFKKKVNMRVDLGFGKRSMSVSLGMNETF